MFYSYKLNKIILGFPPTLQTKSVGHQESVNEPNTNVDIFGAEPFGDSSITDPFGMADFGKVVSLTDQDTNFHSGVLNRRLTEMQEGFKRGISFGGDDFDLKSLDPLRL